MLAITTFSLPIIGSFLTLAAGRFSSRLRNSLAILTMLLTFIATLALIPQARFGLTVDFGSLFLPGLNLSFVVDGLGVYVAATSSFIGLLILLFSLAYMKNYEHQGEYYFLVVLFLGAMMGLVFSANLLVMYIFWEITAICSWRLIGFYRKSQHLRNADTAMLITVFGSFLMLVGIEMIWHETGTLDLDALHGQPVSAWALGFLLVGMLAKSAQVPMQIWLPAAGVAPSTVTALLHAAVLVVIGVFAFARVLVGGIGLPTTWQAPAILVALVTILVAGCAALLENDAKRILAYSTIAQLGYILLGLATLTSIGVAGALLFLLAHSLAKAGLFLCIGIVEQHTHTRQLPELGGLIRQMPVTAIAFILCGLTIVGFPPTLGFFGKLMILMGTLQIGYTTVTVLAVFGALLTLIYMVRLFSAVFLGEERWPQLKESRSIMPVVVMAFAALSVLAGLIVSPLMSAVNGIMTQLLR